ncbi:MAG: hypothetical protein JW966_16040 [Anaerolineae bacterium]|nr:hypothetical protein [Anaerolineae bacterium]
MRRKRLVFFAGLLAAVLILAGCGGNEPSKTVIQGDELYSVTFDEPGNWETGEYPVDAEKPDSTLTIENGRYLIEHTAGRSASFTWGSGGEAVENVIIEVSTEQLSAAGDNLYGVGCRLSANDDGDTSGYVLLISGDGHYGIARLSNRSLTFLLEWHQSGDINQGRAQNTIRAVCVDDYLALYANGTFLGEVKNDDYRRAGHVALAAGVTEAKNVSLAFDDLVVYEGKVK